MKIESGGGALDPTVITRITTLEGKYVRTSRFVSIGSGTSGTITIPANATIVLDDFGGTVDAVVAQIDGGRPTFNSAIDATGAYVSTTFDASGNYSFSAAPVAYPVALVYRVQQTLVNFDSTSSDIFGPPQTTNGDGGPFVKIAGDTMTGPLFSPEIQIYRGSPTDGTFMDISYDPHPSAMRYYISPDDELIIRNSLVLDGGIDMYADGGIQIAGSSGNSPGTKIIDLNFGNEVLLADDGTTSITSANSEQINITSDGDTTLTSNNLGVIKTNQDIDMFDPSIGITGDVSGIISVRGIQNIAFGTNSYSTWDSSFTRTQLNIAFGPNALANIGDEADTNVAIGRNALTGSVDPVSRAVGNVAIGNGTLSSLGSNSNRNVAIGSGALSSLKNGVDDNVAIGSNAANNLIVGTDNTCVGVSAGFGIIAGESNLYLGESSGGSDGSNNIAIGAAAMGGGTANTPSFNTVIGSNSLLNISTGNYNTIIASGDGTGAGNSIVTASNCIVIGYNADVFDDSDGNMSIGNYIYGSGLTGGGATVSNAVIGFGNRNPEASIHVNNFKVGPGAYFQQNNTATTPFQMVFRKSRGTDTSPSVINSSDLLSDIISSGFDGTNYVNSSGIITRAAGTISTGIVPTAMSFQTMDTGGSLSTALTLNADHSTTLINIPALGTAATLFLASNGGIVSSRTPSQVASDIGAFTLPSFTSGSIPFSNGTTLIQDNANLFYNTTTKRVGLGTNTPQYDLDIMRSGVSGVTAHIENTNAGSYSQIGIGNDSFAFKSVWQAFGSSYSSSGPYQANSAVLETAGNLRVNMTNSGNLYLYAGNFAIGTAAPTAYMHIKAGTATAGTSPLKLTAGTNLTTVEDGAIEYNGADFFASAGTTRYKLTNQPVVTNLTGVNAKTVANTVIFSAIPIGKTLIVTGVTIRCTAASAITNGPTIGIGTASGTNDIFASASIAALTGTTNVFGFSLVGMSVSIASGGSVYLNLSTASTGTSQTIAADLRGYYV